MSEGAAIVVMTRLKTARDNNMPILGEYLGASFAISSETDTGLASTNAKAQNLSPLQVG